MVALPEEFIKTTRQLMGEERFNRYLSAFEEEPPVSIRLNPKVPSCLPRLEGALPVPWCRNAYYLSKRPNFTFDPLLHAGCYYVQEAASMFLDIVLHQHITPLTSHHSPLIALDMCAAPGGKSTLMRSALPEGSVLYSNEPVPKRASILLENITKWGYSDCLVTNNYPRDYVQSGLKFDVILCDVPCSGEGMFRKDPQTIGEWSPQNVEKCWRLQRDIVSDAWTCLNDGGLLIYSTCTFNTKENEENIRWMLDTFDAEVLPVNTEPEWNITGSLLPDFNAPVYRFIPGITRSEGLFMAILRKKGKAPPQPLPIKKGRKMHKGESGIHKLQVIPPLLYREGPGVGLVELSYQQAIAYLHGEALMLPADTPRGLVTVCFLGHSLGMVKNLGTRANNLYPKEWRIKSTHVPQEYTPVSNYFLSE